MSDIVNEARYELERSVFASRHEEGIRAIYDWLKLRRDDCNRKWVGLMGEDLTALQGEAKGIAQLIRLLEQGPRIQPEKPKREGNAT